MNRAGSSDGTAKRALKLPMPEWEGQALEGKSILVFDEQGFGDAIQFVRFCLQLAGLGADVVFLCRKRLHRLFNRLTRPLRLVDDIAPGAAFRLSDRSLQPAARTAHARRHDPGANALSQPRCGARRKMEGAAWAQMAF